MSEEQKEENIIPELKLIKHNACRVDLPDDPSYPFKLEMSLRPPELMIVAFVGLCGGSEEIVVRGKTLDALNKFIESNGFRRHPRLRHLTISGPDGIAEQLQK